MGNALAVAHEHVRGVPRFAQGGENGRGLAQGEQAGDAGYNQPAAGQLLLDHRLPGRVDQLWESDLVDIEVCCVREYLHRRQDVEIKKFFPIFAVEMLAIFDCSY